MNHQGHHVYVMSRPGGATKVGISTSLDARIKNLSTLRSRVDIQWLTPVRQNARDVEATAHTILRDTHINGEWFQVSAATAIAAVNKAILMIESGDMSLRQRLPIESRGAGKAGVLLIRLAPDETRALRAAAAHYGRPLSSMARWILNQELQ